VPNRELTSFEKPSRFFLLVDALLLDRLLAPFYRSFARSLGIRGKESVLELGCGTGRGSRHLAEVLDSSGHLTCLDTSAAICNEARRRLSKWDNVEVMAGDIRKMNLMPGSQDIAVIHFVLHDIEPPARPDILLAVTKALKPTGKLYIREPTRPAHGIPVHEICKLMAGVHLTELSGRKHRLGLMGHVYSGVFGKTSGDAKID
jgi:ubiquinone/menaquinone biosynthesis C-methylase UbiE